MLWQPATYGEDLFLRLHDALGGRVVVSGPTGVGLEFLINAERFNDFAGLSATLEVFLRCLRASREFFQSEGHRGAREIGRVLRTEASLPTRLSSDRGFCECAKQAGRIAAQMSRSAKIERDALQSEPRQCYLCDIPLTSHRGARDQFTTEHLWPLSLGGETVADNLLPACQDCNSKRKHFITWAWGPVQSTFHARSGDEAPPGELRLSLALARLMLVAAGNSGTRRRLTLKEAAKRIRPVIPTLNLVQRRHYLFFELFPQIEVLQ